MSSRWDSVGGIIEHVLTWTDEALRGREAFGPARQEISHQSGPFAATLCRQVPTNPLHRSSHFNFYT